MNPIFKERLSLATAIFITIIIALFIGLACILGFQWLAETIAHSFDEDQVIKVILIGFYLLYGLALLIIIPYILYQIGLFIKWLFVEPFLKGADLSTISHVDIEEKRKKDEGKND